MRFLTSNVVKYNVASWLRLNTADCQSMWKLVCQLFWRLHATKYLLYTMSEPFPKANKDFFETGPPWQSHWKWPCRGNFPLKWRILKISMLEEAPRQGVVEAPNPSKWIEFPQFFEAKVWKTSEALPPFCPENLVMRYSCQGTTPRVTSSQQLNGLIHSRRMLDIASSAVLFRCCWVLKWFPLWYGWKMKQEGVAKIWIITLGLASSGKASPTAMKYCNYKN